MNPVVITNIFDTNTHIPTRAHSLVHSPTQSDYQPAAEDRADFAEAEVVPEVRPNARRNTGEHAHAYPRTHA